MRKYTDKEIIEHLKLRKSEGVAHLIDTHLPMIKFMVIDFKYSDGISTISGSENDAEDVFQEALYIIIKKIDADEFKLISRFSTYLYSICKNLLKLKLKRRLLLDKYKVINEDELLVEDEPFDTYTEEMKNQELFDHYFLQLSPVCLKILKLSWLEHTSEEIANKMGNTVKYIHKRKHECKKRLIELIQTNPDDI